MSHKRSYIRVGQWTVMAWLAKMANTYTRKHASKTVPHFHWASMNCVRWLLRWIAMYAPNKDTYAAFAYVMQLLHNPAHSTVSKIAQSILKQRNIRRPITRIGPSTSNPTAICQNTQIKMERCRKTGERDGKLFHENLRCVLACVFGSDGQLCNSQLTAYQWQVLIPPD